MDFSKLSRQTKRDFQVAIINRIYKNIEVLFDNSEETLIRIIIDEFRKQNALGVTSWILEGLDLNTVNFPLLIKNEIEVCRLKKPTDIELNRFRELESQLNLEEEIPNDYVLFRKRQKELWLLSIQHEDATPKQISSLKEMWERLLEEEFPYVDIVLTKGNVTHIMTKLIEFDKEKKKTMQATAKQKETLNSLWEQIYGEPYQYNETLTKSVATRLLKEALETVNSEEYKAKPKAPLATNKQIETLNALWNQIYGEPYQDIDTLTKAEATRLLGEAFEVVKSEEYKAKVKAVPLATEKQKETLNSLWNQIYGEPYQDINTLTKAEATRLLGEAFEVVKSEEYKAKVKSASIATIKQKKTLNTLWKKVYGKPHPKLEMLTKLEAEEILEGTFTQNMENLFANMVTIAIILITNCVTSNKATFVEGKDYEIQEKVITANPLLNKWEYNAALEMLIRIDFCGKSKPLTNTQKEELNFDYAMRIRCSLPKDFIKQDMIEYLSLQVKRKRYKHKSIGELMKALQIPQK